MSVDVVLPLVVLAAIALVAGAIALWRRGGAKRQVVLMLLLAAIMAINVAIWTWPASDGTAPIGRQLR
jgi:flagellar biosynthesis/type III secretory pathway M-ring protein FliF/YscJ